MQKEKETRRNQKRTQNIFRSKRLISDKCEWMLWSVFLEDEALTEIDGKLSDKHGRHFLGEINERCRFCCTVVFGSEVQTTTTDPDHRQGRKLVGFGDLCYSKGKVKGTSKYNLSAKLEQLYTSNDKVVVNFRKDAQTYNNAMAMCSVTVK